MPIPVRPAFSGDNCLACNGFFVFVGTEFNREENKCYNVFKCSPCGRTEKYGTYREACREAD
jgi:hypothetical protein